MPLGGADVEHLQGGRAPRSCLAYRRGIRSGLEPADDSSGWDGTPSGQDPARALPGNVEGARHHDNGVGPPVNQIPN